MLSEEGTGSEEDRMSVDNLSNMGDCMGDDTWDWEGGQEGEGSIGSQNDGKDMPMDDIHENAPKTNAATTETAEPTPPNNISALKAVPMAFGQRAAASSSVREAVELSKGLKKPRGLLAFYTVATAEQKEVHNAAHFEDIRTKAEDGQYMEERAKDKKSQHTKVAQRLRQQKSRHLKKERQIQAGVRSPSGHMKNVSRLLIELQLSPYLLRVEHCMLDLQDTSNSSTTTVAELTRPARALKRKLHLAKKSSGRKETKVIRPATYHNWHTPFVWKQIQRAVKHVGWKMSASAIVKTLQTWDPIVFKGLRNSTVNSWIDRSGSKPKWTEALLHKVDQGNDPGHNKGGQRGVLVRRLAIYGILGSPVYITGKTS